MLAIIGASGQLGSAILDAIIEFELATPDTIIALTSSAPDSDTWKGLESKGVGVRHAAFEDAISLGKALRNVTKFLLISSPRVEMDFGNPPYGQGREKSHITAINCAIEAGVEHIYYTSLAYRNPSKAAVMQAHIRTEEYLSRVKNIKYTIIREGFYSESWPFYLGYYDPVNDERSVIPLGGDGKICWVAIKDLGLANALVLTAPGGRYEGKTFYLTTTANTAKNLEEVAQLVSKTRKRHVAVKIVGRKASESIYSMPPVEWWSSRGDAFEEGECLINDPTLTELLTSMGKKPILLEETINSMVMP